MSTPTAALISVHMDLGAGRRGVDMGPSAIRVAGLSREIADLGFAVKDFGSVRVREPETVSMGEENVRFLDEVVEVCTALRDATLESLEAGALPIVLGGDHSIAIGSGSGTASYYARQDKPIGLLWIDAHTDMNLPETTPSGNIHGMPVTHLLGQGRPELTALSSRTPAIDPERVAMLGIRSVDAREREVVRKSGVRAYTMSEIDERGMAVCLKEALERVTDGTAGYHFSFDLDGVDPRHAPGVGTPVQGGLTYREAHLICEAVARHGGLLSMDMVELNPVLDEANITGKLAVELIASALGKRIL